MRSIPESRAKKKRRSRTQAGLVGAQLVMDELLKRGFEAKLAERRTKKYDVLVGPSGSPPKPVHVRAVHVGPWYVRVSHFTGAVADEVTVYVLFGLDNNLNCARFFVTTNSEMETKFRQPKDWRKFGFLVVEAVKQFENNWDILKT